MKLDRLLDVAEQFPPGDPDGLTLRRLAAEAGVSNGSIYHAFSSKEELLAKVWVRAAWRLLHRAGCPGRARRGRRVVGGRR